ncbi:MAG: L-histidine N(alpha)-methyltransferase [Chromatiales bacterium]|nr:L-histidine N(alpha)-methyltransferase [Chromatiales bacterium]
MQFHDLHPVVESMRTAVLEGLRADPPAIPPRFFYDTRGSELFEAICRQPEYYLPRAERQILRENAAEIGDWLGDGCVLIEPGAGASVKVRLLLEYARPGAYVPMDIAGDFLRRSAGRLAEEYPWLDIHAACVDFCHALDLPEGLPAGRRVAFFPGSSLGNFEPRDAACFLRGIARMVGPGGGLLIGVDTKKDSDRLNAAYNDCGGVTAAFNLNLLDRINRELGANFDLDQFEHRAFYDEDLGRIEMHLESRREQRVRVAGEPFDFDAGTRIHTECSYKYSPAEFTTLAERAGLRLRRRWQDRECLFAVYYLECDSLKPDGLEFALA